MNVPALTLFCALVLCLSMSCIKDKPPVLPAATQTGANTFGCLVNGKVWLPETRSYYPKLTASKSDTNCILTAVRLARTLEVIEGVKVIAFHFHNLRDTGHYTFGSTLSYEVSGDNCSYTQSDNGSVYISRLDTVARIISGTFEIPALANDSCPSKSITEGRFDVRYN